MTSKGRVVAIGAAILALSLALGVGALIGVHGVHAASFAVTNCAAETGAGTIGQAVSDASADAGASESITFGCGAGSHTIPITTPLVIAMPGKTLTINGGGALTLDGGGASQLMQITSSAGTTLENLSFAHGRAPSATAHGGALVVTGSDLTLTNDTFANDVATATTTTLAKGGALYMDGGALTDGGTLTVQNCAFDHDSVIGSSTPEASGGAIFYTGRNAGIGGLFQVEGTVAISDSAFTNDSVSGSQQGAGGAIDIMDASGGSITNSTFDHNFVTSPTGAAFGGAVKIEGSAYLIGGGASLNTVSGDILTYNSALGASASGGAVDVNGKIATLSGSTFDHNAVSGSVSDGRGGALYVGLASDPLRGFAINGEIGTLTTTTFTNNTTSGIFSAVGGAIEMVGFIGAISRSAFVGNSAHNLSSHGVATGGAFERDIDGGDPHALITTPLIIANSTFAANSVTGDAPAFGGALYDAGSILSTLTLVNATLGGDAVNTTSSGSDGGEVFVPAAPNFLSGHILTVSNSILANGMVNGAANNCGVGPGAGSTPGGVVSDVGYNIDSGASCGFASANHSLSAIDPKLGAPTSFAGSTLTYPLQPESPAIDAGNDTVCAAAPVSNIDQRGQTRPQGAHCDSGAFEFVPIATTTTLAANPSIQTQGNPVQLCATVVGASTSVAPMGSVTFKDGGAPLGTATLIAGHICISVSTLAVGYHSITAHYGGDPSFLASISAPQTVTIGVIGKDGTNATPGNGVNPTGPNGDPTAGPVNGSGTGSIGRTGNGATSGNPNAHPVSTPSSGGLPEWLFILLLVVLLAIIGGAGATAYTLVRRRRAAQ
jgi:hypothetical protein